MRSAMRSCSASEPRHSYTRNAFFNNGKLDPGVRLISKPFTVSDLGLELPGALEGKHRG